MNKHYAYIILQDCHDHGNRGDVFKATVTLKEALETIVNEPIGHCNYDIYELSNLENPILNGLKGGKYNE
jgi:hypothetical protein